MKILEWAVPALAALTVPQMGEPSPTEVPAWVSAFFIGVFTLGAYLNWLGRLPGANGERRRYQFSDSDRAKLGKIHETITKEAKPGWPLVWAPAEEIREMRDLIRELAALKVMWEDERDDWKRERATMEARITQLEDVVDRQEHALRIGGSV